MNWIDKIFKDQLGSRKFPDELRNKGKADLEFLLAKEMPVAATKAGRGGLFYGGLSVLLVALISIPAGIWYFQQGDNAEVKQPEYSISFGQAPVTSSEFVLENKVGTSGSWNVDADRNLKYQDTESEEVLAQADHEEVSHEVVARRVDAPSNTSKVASQFLDRNTNSKAANRSETKTEVASNISRKDSKPSSTTLDDNSTVTTVKQSTASKVIADNQDVNNTGDRAPVVATDVNRDFQQSASSTLTDVDKTKSEGASDKIAAELNTGDSEADVVATKRDQPEEENALETTVAKQVDEEKVNLVEVKKQTVADVENTASSVNEEKVEQAAENTELSANPASKLQLSNLAFSDMGTDVGSDLSQYKSLSPKRMAISMWGGYTYVGKTLKGGTPEYLDIRKEKEEAIWTVPTGLTFDYYLTNKWTLSVGAGFSEYGEVLNYDYEYQRKGYEDGRYGSPKNYNGITRLDSVRVITNINEGHWEYYFDYTESDTVIKNNNGQTRWSYVEIPVMFGYRFGSGKLKPWIQLGASVGIPYNQTYRYMSSSGEGLQTRAEGQASASDLQFSGVLNLGFDYYLTRHISLRLNAVGSYQLNPAFKFEGIEQRYYRIGGTIGVAYNF